MPVFGQYWAMVSRPLNLGEKDRASPASTAIGPPTIAPNRMAVSGGGRISGQLKSWCWRDETGVTENQASADGLARGTPGEVNFISTSRSSASNHFREFHV